MKFNTKLWKRSQKSFATTIPHIVLLQVDESKNYDVEWEFDASSGKWTVAFNEARIKAKKEEKILKKKKAKRGGRRGK